MANKKKSQVLSKQEEARLLRARLAELETEDAEQDEVESIPLDKYIKVMSLLDYSLNLTTQSQGKGKKFRFSKFGEVKQIMYKDLVDILEVQAAFLQAGYFLILDRKVVRTQGLDEAYKHILTKERIEDVLNGSANFEELFNACPVEQKEVVISMVIDKLRDNPNALDLNVVDKLSRLSGVEIIRRAREAREYFEERKLAQKAKEEAARV